MRGRFCPHTKLWYVREFSDAFVHATEKALLNKIAHS